MSGRKQVRALIAIFGATALIIGVVWITRPGVKAGAPREIAPLVEVIRAKPRDLRFVVRAQGTVVPRSESDLIPQVSGEVIWVSANLVSGGFFEEGEPLVRIDPADQRVELEAARAVVARTNSEFARAKTEIERQRRLAEQGIASQAQIDDAEKAFRVAEADLREQVAKLERAERDLERTEIRAPYPGRVRSENVDVGQFASRGVSLARLYATDYAEVRLPLPDRDLFYLDLPFDLSGDRSIAADDPVAGREEPEVLLRAEFAGEPRSWIGHIVRTEGEIDAKSRMVNLVARVEDPYGQNETIGSAPLAVGLFVEAEIQGRRVEDVFVLPRTALRTDTGDDLVYVVDAEERLRFTPVAVLRVESEHVVINGGLRVGDRVSVSPMVAAVDGMAVRVVYADEDDERLGREPQPSRDENPLEASVVQGSK